MRAGVRAGGLADAEAIGAADPGGMLGMVAASGRHLLDGHGAGRAASIGSVHPPRTVVVCGMGGSGVAGDIVATLFGEAAAVPLVVSKGYGLPTFCDERTLVLAVSFSGETEETLSAFAEGVARGCRMVGVTTGGRLASLCERDGVAVVRVPPSVSMPRAAVGLLGGACIGVLEAAGVVGPMGREVAEAADALALLAERLGPRVPPEENQAKALALWLGERTPLVWGSQGLGEAAALRWKTQLNENAKIAAFHAVLPELDHNEVEGWPEDSGARFAALVLRHPFEHPRIAARVQATTAAVGGSGLAIRQVEAPAADSSLQALFSLILLGDLTSVYLAVALGEDPTPVPILTRLKDRLGR